MSAEINNIEEVREPGNSRAPSRRTFRMIRKVKVPVTKWVKRKKSEQRGSNSSTSSYISFIFLISSVIGLLEVAYLFKTHPANLWISVAALLIFCFSHATKKKKINQAHWTTSCSQIIHTFHVLSGALVVVSLLSTFLPHRLWWLLFVIWATLVIFTVIYQDGVIKHSSPSRTKMDPLYF